MLWLSGELNGTADCSEIGPSIRGSSGGGNQVAHHACVVVCVVTVSSLPVFLYTTQCRSVLGALPQIIEKKYGSYHFLSLSVSASNSGLRFDTVEVRSSSLLVPTPDWAESSLRFCPGLLACHW